MVESGRRREGRFHGRVEAPEVHNCAHPGCHLPGEFRAPLHRPGSAFGPGDGPPHWQYLCLEHVRAFNAGYNYFDGMSPDEIAAAQSPFPQWERTTRAFASNGYANPERFDDSLGVLRWRYGGGVFDGAATPSGKRLSDADRRALSVFGLDASTTQGEIKRRYKELVRRYHPDANGGDRSHEAKLQDVIQAYTHLKSTATFA